MEKACLPKLQRQHAPGISLDFDIRRDEALASAGERRPGFTPACQGKHHDLRFDSTALLTASVSQIWF